VESTESEILIDEVAEDRPVEKKKSYLGAILFIVVIVLIASAVWYFQSTWMLHAKQSYQQAQTMMHDFMLPEEVDPMAAPAMSSAILTEDSIQHETSSRVVISAVINDEKKEAGLNEVTPEFEVQEKSVEAITSTEIETITGTEIVAQKTQEPVINEDKYAVETDSEPKVAFIEEVVVAKNALKVEPKIIEEEISAANENSTHSDAAKKLSITVVKPEGSLAIARKAFWQRDLPKAEALYKEQISNFKANANSWGELGNIYYLQANWQQAALAYTEAALILIDKGNFPQAMFLRYIITGLDSVQVKRIDESLRKLQAPE